MCVVFVCVCACVCVRACACSTHADLVTYIDNPSLRSDARYDSDHWKIDPAVQKILDRENDGKVREILDMMVCKLRSKGDST